MIFSSKFVEWMLRNVMKESTVFVDYELLRKKWMRNDVRKMIGRVGNVWQPSEQPGIDGMWAMGTREVSVGDGDWRKHFVSPGRLTRFEVVLIRSRNQRTSQSHLNGLSAYGKKQKYSWNEEEMKKLEWGENKKVIVKVRQKLIQLFH